jgi:hypothetical protein
VGARTGNAELPGDNTAVWLRSDEMLARPPSVEPVDILAMKKQLASLRPVSRDASSPSINPG